MTLIWSPLVRKEGIFCISSLTAPSHFHLAYGICTGRGNTIPMIRAPWLTASQCFYLGYGISTGRRDLIPLLGAADPRVDRRGESGVGRSGDDWRIVAHDALKDERRWRFMLGVGRSWIWRHLALFTERCRSSRVEILAVGSGIIPLWKRCVRHLCRTAPVLEGTVLFASV